ncbi:MAG: nickel pincer cofactor biosynthesis protein LarC [Oscillospiraceae bacterium]|nr:nickel pincer cofactor biosynthesis protein LarC [Oscillospiraceae bacterium]
MRILYFDCSMGAAGDMLTASLLELCPDRDAALAELNALGIPEVTFAYEKSVKCGVAGTRLVVSVRGAEEDDHPHEHHHAHRTPTDVKEIVSSLAVPEDVRRNVLAVYDSIARAESEVHGVSMEEIHFHEVGSLDAIADVTAFSYLLHALAPDRIAASPVHVGSGQVRCAHGLLPVPAPATAALLRDVPIYGGEIKGELCTPTGAALLKYYVNSFGPMPEFRPESVGYGMGKRDFPAANCVRAMLGRTEEIPDEMAELSCNLDDMTPEAIGFACQTLREAGAAEVFTTPVQMKKDRPGVLLTVICTPEKRLEMAELMLRHTSTIGVREKLLRRYVLERSVKTVDTPFGPIRKKVSSGYGVLREKYEHDDLARIARERGCSLGEILSELE